MLRVFHKIVICVVLIALPISIFSQGVGNKGKGGGRQPFLEQQLPTVVVANKSLSVILGRPTQNSITANILSANGLEGYIEYGTVKNSYVKQTVKISITVGVPVELLLDNLTADTQYYYRLRSRRPGTVPFDTSEECTFHTQRAVGSAFTFDIQGDSHPERAQQHDSVFYAQTLKAAAADKPDFYMAIGDDFSVDTLRTLDADSIKKVYLHQRYFLSLIGQSAPLFLVNGNHEQAAMCNLDGTANNVAVWAQVNRNSLFPQPGPDKFYTGDTQTVDNIGLLRDYYAWTWGDAQFIVIDPYWHSTMAVDNPLGGGQKTRDLWNTTIGDTQYQWLKKILEDSKSKYKFIFAHHVLGTGRGGIEEATICEWGGYDKNGRYLLSIKRPTWPLPIHQLMAKNGVTIFFQGHDHIFVKQTLDGVIYQTLPEPADPNYALYNADAYFTGDKFPNTGYTRVVVAPDKVTVNYVKQYLPKDETDKQKSGDIAFSYSVTSKKP
ncbi:MAG: metallophosphoesterase [bacterium]